MPLVRGEFKSPLGHKNSALTGDDTALKDVLTKACLVRLVGVQVPHGHLRTFNPGVALPRRSTRAAVPTNDEPRPRVAVPLTGPGATTVA